MNNIILYSLLGILLFLTIIFFSFNQNFTASFLGIKTTEESIGTWLSEGRQADPNNLNKISSLTIVDLNEEK
jgi:hypothetical protein